MLRPNVFRELIIHRNQTTEQRNAEQRLFLCHWSLCSFVFMALCASSSNPAYVSLYIIPQLQDPGKKEAENKFKRTQINLSPSDDFTI